ncbi:uncharacterized protein [Paramisgurnus dabryanus]|uniref:uncharacterized protein isoform X2 n=1 Tax=Paramisgurnus dabryanus TaxID=90735 RepID=UPI0031F3769F
MIHKGQSMITTTRWRCCTTRTRVSGICAVIGQRLNVSSNDKTVVRFLNRNGNGKHSLCFEVWCDPPTIEMESFLRWKLAQSGGTILGGSSFKKPVSSYQHLNLPDLCSAAYSIADEPFPEVSGLLDDTVSQSFLANEAGTALHSPCIPLERRTEHTNEGISVPRNDIVCEELKNSTFDLKQDLKDQSDACVNATVELHNISEKNITFEIVESPEPTEGSAARHNSTVDIAVPLKQTESGNVTIEVVQIHDTKEGSDARANATVEIPNVDCTRDIIHSCSDNSGPSNITTEMPTEKHEGTLDIQPHELEKEKQDGSLNSTGDANINCPLTKNSEENNMKVNVTVEIVEKSDNASPQVSCEINQSSSPTKMPSEGTFIKPNTTTEIDTPVLKDTTIEIQCSSTEITRQTRDGSNLVSSNAETDLNNKETEVETSTTAFVCSVEAPTDSPELKKEEHYKKSDLSDSKCIPSSDAGNISRNSLFSLDDTLDMKTSFLVTSTPIVFGKESRFEILRDTKPTPMRKRLSVINSIEAHSNDDLVGGSHHDETNAAQVAVNSSRSLKVSTHSASSHGTSEPANENKPPTKPPVRRQLPQLSSNRNHPKSSLPPRPSTLNSSVAVRPKAIQEPQVSHMPDASSSAQLCNKKAGQLNRGKNIGAVRNIALANTVKTSMTSSVSGYNFTTVSKPPSSGIPQMKASGLQPPTRKRLALKTPQAARSCLEGIQPQYSNKPTGLPAPSTPPILESDAVQTAKAAHDSDCINCLQHHEKLERFLQELLKLRSECKNWGPLNEKLEMCVEEMKRS